MGSLEEKRGRETLEKRPEEREFYAQEIKHNSIFVQSTLLLLNNTGQIPQ